MQVFKEPLERPQQRGGQILSHEDIKSIFGNIPEILAVHKELVVSSTQPLVQLLLTVCFVTVCRVALKSSCLIGQRLLALAKFFWNRWLGLLASFVGLVLLFQSEGFLRVYPPFVNFFDMSKEALHKCDRAHPRFHAFLKVRQLLACTLLYNNIIVLYEYRLPKMASCCITLC